MHPPPAARTSDTKWHVCVNITHATRAMDSNGGDEDGSNGSNGALQPVATAALIPVVLSLLFIGTCLASGNDVAPRQA